MLKRLNITVLLLLLLTATGGGLLIYRENNSPERKRIHDVEALNLQLQQQVESEKKQKEEFKKFVQRLTTSTPAAEIVVRDPTYSESAAGGVAGEWLVFTEVDPQGKELSTREFWIEGKRAHIDTEVIKFDSSYVEQGDPEKGRSVVLFKSLYDQITPPGRGQEIDKEGEVPPMYRSASMDINLGQKDIWSQFWKLAGDPDYRQSRSVRVAQIEGIACDFEFGYKYKISVDANGGPNIINEKLPASVLNALKNHAAHQTPTAPATNVATP